MIVAGTQMASAMVRNALGIRAWGQPGERIDHSSLISYGRTLHNMADGLLNIETHAQTLARHSKVFSAIELNLKGNVDWRLSAAMVATISLLVIRRSERGKA